PCKQQDLALEQKQRGGRCWQHPLLLQCCPIPCWELLHPWGDPGGSWGELRFTHPSAPHPEAFLLAALMGDQSSQGKTPTLMGDINGHCKHSLNPLQNSHWDKLQPCISEK
ncbi:unnamed protein product, partial [Bubo scandiacus]